MDRARASALHKLIITEVDRLGQSDETQSDIDRIQAAAGNPLRRAPWCDLSDSEAIVVVNSVRAIASLVKQTADHESKSIKDYWSSSGGNFRRAWKTSRIFNGLRSTPNSGRLSGPGNRDGC
jgi:hypothetical protein